MSLAAVVVAFTAPALLAPEAYAGDVTRVALGSTIAELITGADGGAWVDVFRPGRTVVGHATPDGRFSSTPVDDVPVSAALGPDGQAWFKLGAREFVRSDAAGTVTSVRLPGGSAALGRVLASGADGTLWSLTRNGDQVAHVTPEGTATYTSIRLPECGETEFTASGAPTFTAMERASDGAMWVSDSGCSRLVRLTSAGATQVAIKVPDPRELAADANGGIWFAGGRPGHVDAAGKVTRFDLERHDAADVAVAPDGSAWFATGTCRLARVTAGGEVTTAPAPVPAEHIGFDPAGGMWLASRARLVHLAPGEGFGTCDERPPTVRVKLGPRTVSLRALRRTGGVRVTVREPVAISSFAIYSDDSDRRRRLGDFGTTIVTQAKGRTTRVRVPVKELRRYARSLAQGKRPMLSVVVSAVDREGNSSFDQYSARVRR